MSGRLSFGIVIIILIISVNVAGAFEIDGLKSGMSKEQAKKVLDSFSFSDIRIENDNIIAQDKEKKDGRLLALVFCKGKLVQVQKHLKPRFDYFARLVNEKRRELGKPADAWAKPTDVMSNIEDNEVTILWKNGPTFVKVTYHDFGSSNQLDIIYVMSNTCYQTPY